MDLISAAAGGETAGAQLPTIAGNSDFSSESVAVSGQNGVTNQFAGFDVDQLRQQMQRGEADSSLMGTPAAPAGQSGGLVWAHCAAMQVAWEMGRTPGVWARFSATSSQISHTDRSSGPEAMAPSTLRISPSAVRRLWNQLWTEPVRVDVYWRSLHPEAASRRHKRLSLPGAQHATLVATLRRIRYGSYGGGTRRQSCSIRQEQLLWSGSEVSSSSSRWG
jgi:hypothetical protein